MRPITAAHEVGVAAHLLAASGALDNELVIDGEDGHHLQRVRRLRVGEHLTVADGEGQWRRYQIVATGNGVLDVRATDIARREPEPISAVVIAPALSKGTKLETLAMHLTELGVAEIRPVLMERSVVRVDAAGAERLHARLCAAVRAGAMQSRRSRLPLVVGVAGIESLSGEGALLVATHDGDAAALGVLGPSTRCTIVTGPEGGITPAEREQLAAMGALPFSLGPYVLRAETAPLAAAILALSR